eukprot:5865391-Pleurochrysis_carterae.AAC.1
MADCISPEVCRNDVDGRFSSATNADVATHKPAAWKMRQHHMQMNMRSPLGVELRSECEYDFAQPSSQRFSG